MPEVEMDCSTHSDELKPKVRRRARFKVNCATVASTVALTE